MELRLCTVKEIESIYNNHIINDFPPDEVKPLKRILFLAEKDLYFVYGVFEDEKLISYAFISGAPNCDYVLLDYLAVVSGRRGIGIGSRAMKLLKEEICKTHTGILLESENPEYAHDEKDKKTRERRIKFYLNCGFELTKMQSCLFGVQYKIMVYAKKMPSTLSVTHAITDLYQALIAEKHLKDNVSLHVED